jgi:hypothetical protein
MNTEDANQQATLCEKRLWRPHVVMLRARKLKVCNLCNNMLHDIRTDVHYGVTSLMGLSTFAASVENKETRTYCVDEPRTDTTSSTLFLRARNHFSSFCIATTLCHESPLESPLYRKKVPHSYYFFHSLFIDNKSAPNLRRKRNHGMQSIHH